MITLDNEFKVEGIPTMLKYKKQQNGLYEVTIGDYDFISPTGDKQIGTVRFTDCALNLDKDEGVICLENIDLSEVMFMLTKSKIYKNPTDEKVLYEFHISESE